MKNFVPHTGEMGQLIMAKDWSTTTIGPMKDWPATLKVVLGTMLHSRFPGFLFWGDDLTCFYNDAYRPSLGKEGKHPDMLGMKGEEAWPEIWDTIKPLIDQVLSGEGACYFEDMLVPIYRNGQIEDVYWTFSYSPAFDEQGAIAGVLVTCVETTDKVIMRKGQEELSAHLTRVLKQAPVAITYCIGPDHLLSVMNQMALDLVEKQEGEVLGRPMFEIFPELIDQGLKQLMDNVYQSKKSFSAQEMPVTLSINDEMTTLYLNFIYEPVFGPDGEVEGVIAVGTDVSESVQARRELHDAFEKIEESERQFKLLADSMPQFVWAAGPDGRLHYFNQAVFDYSGLTYEQIEGEDWLQIVHPDDQAENVRLWTESITTGKDFIIEHRFRRYDGQYRWQLSRATPEKDDEGNIRMWIGTSTDIQQIKEAEMEKDVFIGMASHELKTPLTSIKGYVDILRGMYEDSDDAFLNDSLSTINRQVATLVSLITDMLDLSKMKSGTLILNKEKFCMNHMIDKVLEEIRYSNPNNRIVYSSSEELKIFGDETRISQVLVNFLTNAIKYTPDESDIHVEMKRLEDFVMVSVTDKGIGISKEDQERIFDRFYRVEGKNEGTYPGFGIGLYIAADIIRRHGGEIGVDSRLKKGSTFYFKIPIQAQ